MQGKREEGRAMMDKAYIDSLPTMPIEEILEHWVGLTALRNADMDGTTDTPDTSKE